MTLNASGIAPLMVAGGVASSAFGQYTGDGSGAITVALGFTPIKVRVYNMTTPAVWDWNAGMAATESLKITSGAIATETDSSIVSNHSIQSVSSSGVYAPGQGPGDGTLINTSVVVDSPNPALPQLVFGTSLNVSTDLYAWEAFG